MITYFNTVREACKLFSRDFVDNVAFFYFSCKDINEENLETISSVFNSLASQYLAFLLSQCDKDEEDIEEFLSIEKEKIGFPTDRYAVFTDSQTINAFSVLAQEGFIEFDSWDFDSEFFTYKIPLMVFKRLNEVCDEAEEGN